MDDARIRDFETDLWTGKGEVYRNRVGEDCLMVLPEHPFVMSGEEAIKAVSNTPRWSDVELRDLQISRPEEGLIVVAYEAKASRGDESYRAFCTTTYRRLGHENWRVIQHQQTLPTAKSVGGS